MPLVDITMTIYEGMGIGNVWPHEQPFKIEDMLTVEKHGIRLVRLIMYQEPGTRFNLASLSVEQKGERTTLETHNLESLVDVPTLIIHIPKGPEEQITAEEIEKAFTEKADLYQEGDAVIIHTGWGDNGRYFELGEDYALRSPSYSNEGAQKLAEILTAHKTKIFGYDTASMGHPRAHIIPKWCSRNPRPASGTSPEARDWIENYYDKQKLLEDWGGVLPVIRAGVHILGGIVNIGSIPVDRVKLTVLPLKIRGLSGGPCRAFVRY